MKPTSIIFLIISAVIIVIGLVVCNIGTRKAKDMDIELFETDVQTSGDNQIRTYDFTDDEITRLKITAGEADVYLYPAEGSTSYVELVNFQVGEYTLSVENHILIVNNKSSLMSVLDIAEGNFSFNGLRHYLTYTSGLNSGEKRINVYLSRDLSPKIFNVTVDEGNIVAEKLYFPSDYHLETKKGNIELSHIATSSLLDLIVSEKGDVSLGRSRVQNLKITVAEGNVTGVLCSDDYRNTSSVTVGLGNVELETDFSLNMISQHYQVTSDGSVVVEGDKRGKTYEQAGVEEGELSVQVESGNIEVKPTEVNSPSDDTGESDTAQ